MLVTVRIFKNILIENRFLEFANNLSYCMSIEVCYVVGDHLFNHNR